MCTNWLIEHIENDKKYAAEKMKDRNWLSIVKYHLDYYAETNFYYNSKREPYIEEFIDFVDGNGFVVITREYLPIGMDDTHVTIRRME